MSRRSLSRCVRLGLSAGLLASCAALVSDANAADTALLRQSIIKVVSTANPPVQLRPWLRAGPIVSSGSGVVISSDRILTAAHVVADQVMIEVQRGGTGKRYTANVEHVCHSCDLALLTVSDPAFFEDARPLKIGDLPRLRQAVEVYGFPEGGDGLSITSGIISRIDVDSYAHSRAKLLLVQVDAAINSGNSGGPAISNGRVVGIAMQALEDAENIGYIVPSPIIEHFLDDVKDGHFDGFPELDFLVQPLANPSLRGKLGMGDLPGGVLVTAVGLRGSADGLIRPGDVLLEIGGVTISEDFTAEVKEGVRVDATVLEHQAQVGDRVTVVVLREGRRLELPVVMKVPSPLVPTGEYDRDLPYRIFAGLVFQPLTQRYLSEYQEPPSHLNAFLMNPERGGYSMLVPSQGVKDRREVVVITNVLGSELSRGYEDFEDEVVYAMNGTPIRDLRHLSELLDTSNEEFVTITTEMGHVILIEPGRAKLASGELLEVYKIAADRSPELQPPANPTD